MGEVSKYITVFFSLLFSLIALILPGLIFVWIWAALRAVGLGVLWIILIILAIIAILAIPIFTYWRDMARYFSGFC